MVFADIELINGEDLVMARKNMIGEDEVRRFPLNILVDSGTHQLVLNGIFSSSCNCLFWVERKPRWQMAE